MKKITLAALGLSVAAIASPALAQDALPVRIFPNLANTGPTATTGPDRRAVGTPGGDCKVCGFGSAKYF